MGIALATWTAVVPIEWDEAVAGHYWNVAVIDDGGSTSIFVTSDPWNGGAGQVLRSVDGGPFDQVFSRSRPDGEWMSGAMLGLAVDPNEPSVMYVSQDGGEVFRSADGGSSWQATAGQPDGNGFTFIQGNLR